MGMFNSIIAKLPCPNTPNLEVESEIQIKWQLKEFRLLNVYYVGDHLLGLMPNYNNKWVLTDYICMACTPLHEGKYGKYFKSDDQVRHQVYIHITHGYISEITLTLPKGVAPSNIVNEV